MKQMIVAAIPAYNEEATIAKVIQLARKYVNRIIVCDDGSTDATSKIAERLGATVVRHERNLGKGAALRSLFEEARKFNATLMITLDADGQHDPSQIPQLIDAIKRRRADIVVGSRFMKGNGNNGYAPLYRFLGNKILNRLTDKRVSDTQSGFRVYGRSAINSLAPKSMGMGVDSEILLKAREIGLRTVEIPIKVIYDVPYPSKRNFLFQTGEVIISLIRSVPVRRPVVFYSLSSFIMLSIAIGFWAGTLLGTAKTAQMMISAIMAAVAATIVGLVLLVVSIMTWKSTSAAAESATRKKKSG